MTIDLISRHLTVVCGIVLGVRANESTRQIMKARGSISVSFDLGFCSEAVEV